MENKKDFFAENSGNYAETMLSLYLWGEYTPPTPDKITTYSFNETREPVIIPVKDYMEKVGNNIPLAQSRLVQVFFNSTTKEDFMKGTTNSLVDYIKQQPKNDANEVILTYQHFIDKAYDYNKLSRDEQVKLDALNIPASQYSIDPTTPDYWQRALVFGSTSLNLDTQQIQFVFDATTGKAKELRNVFVKPNADNYDLVSSDGLAGMVNPVLRRLTDPSGIGRKVDIQYEGDPVAYNYGKNDGKLGIFTVDDYREYIQKHSSDGNAIKPDTLSPYNLNTIHTLFDGMKKNASVTICSI